MAPQSSINCKAGCPKNPEIDVDCSYNPENVTTLGGSIFITLTL